MDPYAVFDDADMVGGTLHGAYMSDVYVPDAEARRLADERAHRQTDALINRPHATNDPREAAALARAGLDPAEAILAEPDDLDERYGTVAEEWGGGSLPGHASGGVVTFQWNFDTEAIRQEMAKVAALFDGMVKRVLDATLVWDTSAFRDLLPSEPAPIYHGNPARFHVDDVIDSMRFAVPLLSHRQIEPIKLTDLSS